jgi:hypothetical protein
MATVPKSSPKARAQNIVKSEDGTNGRILTYLCSEHSIEECFKDGFFNVVSSNLLPGDVIRCIQITRERRSEDAVVTASWTGIVLKVTKKMQREEVIFVPEIAGSKKQDYVIPTEEDIAKEEPYVGPQYVQGSGQVEKNKNGTFTVTVGGKDVATVRTKAEASAIARGDVPIPENPLI